MASASPSSSRTGSLSAATICAASRSAASVRTISRTGNSLGANNYYTGTLNIDYPLGLPEELGIRGHTFVDFGSAWGINVQPQFPAIRSAIRQPSVFRQVSASHGNRRSARSILISPMRSRKSHTIIVNWSGSASERGSNHAILVSPGRHRAPQLSGFAPRCR